MLFQKELGGQQYIPVIIYDENAGIDLFGFLVHGAYKSNKNVRICTNNERI
jgi:hypothetical protein